MSQAPSTARLFALVAVALALGVSVSSAQQRQGGAAGITVFDDVNFEGPTVTLRGDVADVLLRSRAPCFE